jgi:hypothetical protein
MDARFCMERLWHTERPKREGVRILSPNLRCAHTSLSISGLRTCTVADATRDTVQNSPRCARESGHADKQTSRAALFGLCLVFLVYSHFSYGFTFTWMTPLNPRSPRSRAIALCCLQIPCSPRHCAAAAPARNCTDPMQPQQIIPNPILDLVQLHLVAGAMLNTTQKAKIISRVMYGWCFYARRYRR